MRCRPVLQLADCAAVRGWWTSLRWGSGRVPRLLRHVLAQHPVHARLPAVAGGLEIGDDFGAVAHRDQSFGVFRAGASAQGFHRHHRSELRVRQGLGVWVAQCGGVNAFSRYENGKTKPPFALVNLLEELDRCPDLLSEVRVSCVMRKIRLEEDGVIAN